MSPVKKGDYYKARENVNLPFEGGYELVQKDQVVPANSPLLKKLSKAALEEHFRPVTPGGGAVDGFGQWDVETATAAPGEKRGASAS
jgi:hypothetical protein